jgi:hypothetical protein
LEPTQGKMPSMKEHFILQSIASWWGKMLPSQFGIYLRLERGAGEEAGTLLMIFRKGRLAEFDSPDLSSISTERRKDLNEVVKVLRERYGVPVQAFVMDRADFSEWSEETEPSAAWKRISKALRQDRIQLVPFRFGVAAMIGARGIFGV